MAQVSHVTSELVLQIPGENLGTSYSLVKRETRNVPSTKNKVIGVNHVQDVTERCYDFT